MWLLCPAGLRFIRRSGAGSGRSECRATRFQMVILCPLAAGFPGGCQGERVAAQLRPCEGSGQDDGHFVILAAHPVWDDGTCTSGLASAPAPCGRTSRRPKMAVAGSSLLLSGWPAGGDSPERGGARRRGDDPILRWPRRCGADAAGRCMTGQRRAGPGSHRKRSAGAVSGPPGSGEPGPARSARSGAR